MLPNFIKPMLAERGEAFDSDEHLFEIKWDGIRAMAYIDEDGYRLMSRRGIDVTERYPEFEPLRELPPGTVLDGEIVVLDEDGKPSFRSVLSREQARTQQRFRNLSKATPANFVAFDLLYRDYNEIMRRPLSERREQLLATTALALSERFAVSDGVVGPGRAFFDQIVARDLEGVMAKRLKGRYFPGRRSDVWIKIRKSSTALCAILGFVDKGDDFESLIIATEDDGELSCVGRVGTGFDTALRDALNQMLRQNVCHQPLIPCDEKGTWIEAGLYCSVRYLERTKDGVFREPVFEKLITEE